MGVVFICYAHRQKAYVALKTLQRKKILVFKRERGNVRREPCLACAQHPNIVRAYFVDQFHGFLFIALEFVAPDKKGRNTLTHFLGRLTMEQIILISMQICDGMKYVYSKGVDVHRRY